MTDSIQSSTIGMSVRANMGVAVGISLLSCRDVGEAYRVETEAYVSEMKYHILFYGT